MQKPARRHHRMRHPAFVGIVAALGALIWVLGPWHSQAHAAQAHIASGIHGYCLDDYHSRIVPDAVVDIWTCNNTSAQSWVVNGDTIRHSGTYCLGVEGGRTAIGTAVVLNDCNSTPGQVWLEDGSGFQNPNSSLCLGIGKSKEGALVSLVHCDVSQGSERWYPSGGPVGGTCPNSSEGARVACFAEKEWSLWQSSSPGHVALLNAYSDGNGYEEWCADFVSYVYKEAGYPFSGGERDGWDEYDANKIRNMGFTYHDADGYQPKAGDVAYFDYQGGHVEVVVSGGPYPTFVYGDSGTKDPATGNGDMKANTITSDGGLGGVVYYLSPQ